MHSQIQLLTGGDYCVKPCMHVGGKKVHVHFRCWHMSTKRCSDTLTQGLDHFGTWIYQLQVHKRDCPLAEHTHTQYIYYIYLAHGHTREELMWIYRHPHAFILCCLFLILGVIRPSRYQPYIYIYISK